MSGNGAPPGADKNLGEIVSEVSEKASLLVREEIELAKAEVSEKISQLARGGAVGIAAGVFAFLGLILLMHAIAWLLNDLFFDNDVWAGFLIEGIIFFLVAGVAGYLAYRAFQKGAPPIPEMAIDEGKRIKQTLESGTTPEPVKEPQP